MQQPVEQRRSQRRTIGERARPLRERQVAGEHREAPATVWSLFGERLGADASGFGYVRRDRDAAAHLFRVVSGMDSMVVGEAQIHGQVRDAWEAT